MGQRRPVRAKRSPRQLRAGPTDDPVLANRRRLAELARAPQIKLATPPLPDGPTVAYAAKLAKIAREAYRIADRTVGAALRDLQRLADEKQDADSDPEAKRKRAAAQNRPHTEAEKRQLSLPLELEDAIDRMQRAEEAYAERLPTTDLAMTAAIATERWSAGVQMRVFQSLGLNPIPLGSKLETARDEWVQANSQLIVSQPREVSQRVGQLVREMVPAGSRWETISARLQEEEGIAERRANLIARDQVAKYNADLTRMQQQAVGFSHYEWRGAMDARERPTHVALEGTIWSWERPPLIGNPGEPIQCRCVAIPVTSAEVMARSKELGEEELIERTAALGPTQRQGPDATPEEVRKRAAREVEAEIKMARRRVQ